MTRNLAPNLKPIRVNLVSPGPVDPELWGQMPAAVEEKLFEEREATLPTGRAGRVENVAKAFIYAMNDQNSAGSMIITNAGHLLVGL
jgi:NAD(P)-dependent dehydrogenase (short-subunit alcohol dehydrogenase family)